MNISVIHSLPGRVRFNIPGLRGNRSLAEVISQGMARLTGIRSVLANPLTGRVLVLYKEGQLNQRILMELLRELKVRMEHEGHGGQVRSGNRPYEAMTPARLQEPEDLPIRRQVINVAFGGGVLAYVGLKHLLYGRTPLAKNLPIFNLTAITAIVSGYPVLRNGFKGLARGRVNHDLVMSVLALGTVLARESVPGLLVITLANVTALAQSLVYRSYLNALPRIPELPAESIEQHGRLTALKWDDAGQEYSRKMMLPVLGMASWAGFTGGQGGFQKALAMLLAANPSPAGLAATTAATATMAKAGRKGILYRGNRTLEMLSEVDTVIFSGIEALNSPTYRLGDLLPMPGIGKNKLLNLVSDTSNVNDFYGLILRKALGPRGQPASRMDLDPVNSGPLLVGDEKTFIAAGIDTRMGTFKARRLQHLAQIPLYVAVQGRLVGLIGIKPSNVLNLREMVRGLRAQGIRNIGLTLERESSVVKQTARELGINQVWSGVSTGSKVELIRKLRNQGHKIAVVSGNTGEENLFQEPVVSICLKEHLKKIPVDVVIPDLSLLPDVFRLALRAEQRAKQNLALVQAANVVGLALGATGWLPPMAANVYNNITSIAVGANSYRLLSGRKHLGKGYSTILPGTKAEIAASLATANHLVDVSQKDCLEQYKCSNWHSLSVEEALDKLKTSLTSGLTANDVQRSMLLVGPNKMAEEQPPGFLKRLWGQFKDFLVKTLMASAVICALLGEFGDALAIVFILAINAILGVMQEQKAEGALRALGKMTAPTAKVKREGEIQRVAAADLVPGDIVLLEQGDGVPADLRLLQTHGLEVEESALTGESYPVPKKASRMTDCIPLLDCENLVFMGTNITRGKAVGLVIATGMSTEIGKIAGMLNQQDREPTPLQNRMADVGSVILKYCLAVSGLVVLAGVLRGGSLFKMFLNGVSLAVAAIPEGLPAVVTIALASGVRRMAKENAVVRRLPAVETLGSATLICTDKTGTLTQNRQQIQSVYTGGQWWQIQSDERQLKPVEPGNHDQQDLMAVLTSGVLCNDANLQWTHGKSTRGKPRWRVEGDPTEGALLLAALHQEINYRELGQKWQRVKELPFDAERLRMTVICREELRGTMAFVKGAPEVVLKLCSLVQKNGEAVPLTSGDYSAMLEANERMAGNAMRILAIAYKPLSQPDIEDAEQDLILLGLVGMVDPPRPEVKEAVARCHRAGIKVVMITGDHPHTALAVANMVGLTNNQKVLTGGQIDQLNDHELAAAMRDVRVFARVLPGQKLRLVKTFRSRGEILAMVGDGINDAPAVKEGDIGVAMGQTGTDVTKQAADIILTDDNFATLVSAVEQGRGIYGNIRRSVRYLLSTNVGLVLIVFLSVLIGMEMPLLPIQLLFLNVLGDGLPALALGVESPSKDLMNKPPRGAKQSFFADGLGTQIITRGIATGLVGLETYHRVLKQGNLGRARTVVLASFIASKLLFALECSDRRKEGEYTTYLLGSVALSAILLAGAIYLPLGRRIFKTSPLGLTDVSTVLGASGVTYILDKVLTAFWKSKDHMNVKEIM